MRISAKPIRGYPWYLRLLFRIQKKKYGEILNPALLWGRSPKLLFALTAFFRMVDRKNSPLSPELRSLVMVRVSQINWCPFCIDMNSAAFTARSHDPTKLKDLHKWKESKLFDEQERAALEYAEAMTYPEHKVSDELFGRLKKLFTEDAIVELTGLIAFQNLSSKFNSALDIPAQGLCRISTDSHL